VPISAVPNSHELSYRGEKGEDGVLIFYRCIFMQHGLNSELSAPDAFFHDRVCNTELNTYTFQCVMRP